MSSGRAKHRKFASLPGVPIGAETHAEIVEDGAEKGFGSLKMEIELDVFPSHIGMVSRLYGTLSITARQGCGMLYP